MPSVSDIKQFTAIRNRVNDVFNTSPEDIEANRTVHMSGKIFDEQLFLVRECERLKVRDMLNKEEQARFDAIVTRLKTIRRNYRDQIKGGEHLKVNIALFKEQRWLITILETATGEQPVEDDDWDDEDDADPAAVIEIPDPDLVESK